MQTIPESKFQLTYCDNIESIQGNIINVNSDFMSILKSDQQISIQGNAEDQLIFNVGDKNFKLRGIYLPTTMLIVPTLNTTSLSDNSNSNSPSSSVAKIYLETFNYLKIQNHEMDFQHIYSEISAISLSENIISQKLSYQQILQNEGILLSELKSRYQITAVQIEKLARAAPFTFFHIDETQDTLVMQLSQTFMIAILRQLLPVLTSKGLIGEWFTYNQVKLEVPVIHQKFLEVITRHFSLQSQPILPPATIIHSEQCFQERRYKVTLDTILQFILVELILVKHQYLAEQMQELIKKMLKVYLPIGNEQFCEQKARQRVGKLIGKYFMSVSKGNQNIRIYYNPLLFDFNLKGRIQKMSDFKKRFCRSEINGMFSFWYTSVQIEDILLKNFRKMGKDYEIKLIIPK